MNHNKKFAASTATGAALAGVLLLSACGGGSGKVSLSQSKTTAAPSTTVAASTTLAPTTTAPTTLPPATTAPATTAPATTAPATTAPAGTGTAKTAALSIGAANGFPFGSVNDSGTPISLLPPNASYVDTALVASAPSVGPFTINPNGGPSGWPDACTMTSAAQLEGLFPAITGLSGAPVGTKGTFLGGGNTPNNSQCQFNLTTSFDAAADEPGTPSWVEIDLEEIDSGAPQSYQTAQQQQAGEASQFPAQYGNYPDLGHGLSCFSDANELQCITGDVNFWIEGQKVTGGNYDTTDQAEWVVQVELPLAEKLATEITQS